MCELHARRLGRDTTGGRGSSTRRGYGASHVTEFRTAILAGDPYCVLCGDEAEVADHYPHTRVELIKLGLNPNDPEHGRALCKPCHDTHTAETSRPGHIKPWK